MTRVVRVLPDVTAVDRAFDYTIDVDVPVGTIVRVPLAGRRVRGWIVADDVAPEVASLLAVVGVVSAGPPEAVVALTEWIAHRWCGPRVALLRSASAPNVVLPLPVCAGSPAIGGLPAHPEYRVVRRPPLADRRAEVGALCAAEGSTIVVVADAGRARSLAAYLSEQGHAVAVLHSVDTDAARTVAWRRAAAGDCIVIGGRIAALAPVPDLRAAVVVDDADEALQEERAPTWHARDVLQERAARGGAPFTVFSPAPTVEALDASDVIDAPAADVERRAWPRVLVVDRRTEPPGAGLLSEALAAALRGADGLRVCILNRRGRFRLLVCASCAHLLRWEPADDRPGVCPECGSTKLRVLRSGVKRVREELEALIPGSRVADVDAETASVPVADIVIGTEAALHRSEVRRRRPALIAYLDLDQELLAPRYRAAAQAHWLVTRGAQLLAARPRPETLLVLQTRLPDHTVVHAVQEGLPGMVADAELEYRRVLGYPPFGALAELSGEHDAVRATVDALRTSSGRAAGVQVFGPNDDRALVVAPAWDALADALVPAVATGRKHGRVRASVDPPRT